MRLDRDEVFLARLLLWFGPLTRKRLGELGGFSRGQTARLVDDLLIRGWIDVGAPEEKMVGRPSPLVRIKPHLGLAAAISIEDDRCAVSLATADLHRLGQRVFGYSLSDPPAHLLKELQLSLRSLFNEYDPGAAIPRLGIAVSAPGPVEQGLRSVFRPLPALEWHGFDLVEQLRTHWNCPVLLDNDANAATLGELLRQRRLGFSSGLENWLVVKMNSTGIGAGIISNGLLHGGSAGEAGEIGHLEIVDRGIRCACGLTGCLEAYAGAPAVLAQARRAAELGQSASLNRLLRETSAIGIAEMAIAVREGDECAQTLILEAGGRIGRAVAGAVAILNPSAVFLAGKFATVSTLLIAAVRQTVYAKASSASTQNTVVEFLSNPEAELDGALVQTVDRFLTVSALPKPVPAFLAGLV